MIERMIRMIAKFLTENTQAKKTALSVLSKFKFEKEFEHKFFPLKNSIILTDGKPGNWFRISEGDGGDIVLSMKEDGRPGFGKNYIVFLSYSGKKDELLLTDAAPTSVSHVVGSFEDSGSYEAEDASDYTRELIKDMSKMSVDGILKKMESLHDRWDKK